MKRVWIAAALVVAFFTTAGYAGAGVINGYGLMSGNFGLVSFGTDFTPFNERYTALPAGSYIANASIVVASNDPAYHFVDCAFQIGGITDGGHITRGIIGGTVNNFVTLPLTVAFTITQPQDVALACRSEVNGYVHSQPSPITFIQVDRLTTQ
jgi:hypothetical protein